MPPVPAYPSDEPEKERLPTIDEIVDAIFEGRRKAPPIEGVSMLTFHLPIYLKREQRRGYPA